MKIKSKRGLEKVEVAEALSKNGLVTFHSQQSALNLYTMLLLACNRLNPNDPWRVYRYLYAEMGRYMKQTKHNKKKAQRAKQERIGALKRELAMMQSPGTCPCCDATWDTSEIIPDTIIE